LWCKTKQTFHLFVWFDVWFLFFSSSCACFFCFFGLLIFLLIALLFFLFHHPRNHLCAILKETHLFVLRCWDTHTHTQREREWVGESERERQTTRKLLVLLALINW
jgi:hypothetical protein